MRWAVLTNVALALLCSVHIVESQSIVTCSCDLTSSACDANCCCDPDCSTADVDTFVCSNSTYNQDSRLCVNELVYVNNLPETAVVNDNGVFCIITQRDASSNFYTDPTILNTSTELDTAAQQYPTFSYDLTTPITTTTDTFYKTGDTIVIEYSNSLQGKFLFPVAGAANLCIDSNPASFMNDQTSSCGRRFTSLGSVCTSGSGSVLDALTYYNAFVIAQLPFINSSVQVPMVSITVCDGSVPPTPSFAAGICSNAVVSVAYTITYNGTDGISSACVSFPQFSDVSSTSVMQSFSISYVAAGTVLNETSPRSGNPGYVSGKPLRTSRLTEGNRTLDTTVLTLLIPNSNGDGTCTGVTDTQINFGEDSRTGCLLSFLRTQNCAELYNITKLLLNIPDSGDLYVANYGNTLVNSTETDDWLLVTGTLPNPPGSATTVGDASGCAGMLVGINYDVFFANTGSLSNPQPEIIGVRYSGITSTVKYECFGTNCISNSVSQSVEISSTVTFTDASSSPSTILSERPTVNARLSSDFFYPFAGSTA